MTKCKQCGQLNGVHKMGCESRKIVIMENNIVSDAFNGKKLTKPKQSNLTRIKRVLEFYRKRGCNSEFANKVYRKIINSKKLC